MKILIDLDKCVKASIYGFGWRVFRERSDRLSAQHSHIVLAFSDLKYYSHLCPFLTHLICSVSPFHYPRKREEDLQTYWMLNIYGPHYRSGSYGKSFVRNCQISISISFEWEFQLLHILSRVCCCQFHHSNRCISGVSLFWACISLMTYDTEHLFMCLFAISVFFNEVYIKVFGSFFKGCL